VLVLVTASLELVLAQVSEFHMRRLLPRIHLDTLPLTDPHWNLVLGLVKHQSSRFLQKMGETFRFHVPEP